MRSIPRRQFLKTSAAAGVAWSLPAASFGRVIGANDELRVACVGLRGRGNDLLKGFMAQKGVRIVALCDVDAKVLESRAAEVVKSGTTPDLVKDLRAVLDRKDVDAVVIATPNHWHALQGIWAVQAGKDVYVEKPVSHNVWEGRQLVKAARKHGRIVQTGTQSRSSPSLKEAVAFVRAGNLGQIVCVRGLCYKPRQSIGKVEAPTLIPEHIDYDLWCGPAPKNPLSRKNLHYDWHWVFDTGNGDLGNQGIHQMDIARWFLGEKQLSSEVISIGGRVGYQDDGNTPNTQIVFHRFASAPLIFEVRGLPSRKEHQGGEWGRNMDSFLGASIGVIVHCESGYLSVPSYTSADAFDLQGNKVKSFEGGGDHIENFVAAVKSRRREDLNADIEEGHLSSALCHTGNVSYLLGKPASRSEMRAAIGANLLLSEAFGRMEAHLASNLLDFEKDGVRLGRTLRMDSAAERVLGDEQASRLLTREYRSPFVVSDVA